MTIYNIDHPWCLRFFPEREIKPHMLNTQFVDVTVSRMTDMRRKKYAVLFSNQRKNNPGLEQIEQAMTSTSVLDVISSRTV